MTLAPCDNRNVRAVAASRYPLNQTCSHPECGEKAEDAHHGFRRSAIAGDSWFVELDGKEVLPHVTGLCRKHHQDVTVHRAWIKLEGTEFVWYDRLSSEEVADTYGDPPLAADVWRNLGPLSPQPGSREAPPKRKKRAQQPGPARKKAVVSVRVPLKEREGDEDGAAVLTTLIEACRERLANGLGWSLEGDATYYTLTAVLHDWLTGGCDE